MGVGRWALGVERLVFSVRKWVMGCGSGNDFIPNLKFSPSLSFLVNYSRVLFLT